MNILYNAVINILFKMKQYLEKCMYKKTEKVVNRFFDFHHVNVMPTFKTIALKTTEDNQPLKDC